LVNVIPINLASVIDISRCDLIMKLQLQVSEREGGKGNVSKRVFSFAIIDLDKVDSYPLNFVCMLPLNIDPDGKTARAFTKVFGDRNVEVAQNLLHEALERETSAEVKTEIERRLKLLEAKPDVEKRCLSCGKIFGAKPNHGFKQKYCPECFNRKYGIRK
jgi:hypothetical protein